MCGLWLFDALPFPFNAPHFRTKTNDRGAALQSRRDHIACALFYRNPEFRLIIIKVLVQSICKLRTYLNSADSKASDEWRKKLIFYRAKTPIIYLMMYSEFEHRLLHAICINRAVEIVSCVQGYIEWNQGRLLIIYNKGYEVKKVFYENSSLTMKIFY